MANNNLAQEFVKHYDKLKIVALTLERDHNDALDLLQELAELILEKGSNLPEVRNPEAYFRTCLRHMKLNKIKKKQREDILEPDAIEFKAPPHLDYEASIVEIIDWVNNQLRNSQPEMREAFIKYHIEGYTLEELASDLRITTNTLSQNFSRMRKRLKRESPELYLIFILMVLYHSELR